MTAKTIICVIDSLNVGGAERHIVQMLPRLDRNRWKPLVYCITERSPLADELETNGVPVLTSPIKAPQKGASRVRRAMLLARTTLSLAGTIKKLNPAIAHFFLPAPYILGAPHRLKYFRAIVEMIAAKKDVMFWTGSQIADWYVGTTGRP